MQKLNQRVLHLLNLIFKISNHQGQDQYQNQHNFIVLTWYLQPPRSQHSCFNKVLEWLSDLAKQWSDLIMIKSRVQLLYFVNRKKSNANTILISRAWTGSCCNSWRYERGSILQISFCCLAPFHLWRLSLKPNFTTPEYGNPHVARTGIEILVHDLATPEQGQCCLLTATRRGPRCPRSCWVRLRSSKYGSKLVTCPFFLLVHFVNLF